MNVVYIEFISFAIMMGLGFTLGIFVHHIFFGIKHVKNFQKTLEDLYSIHVRNCDNLYLKTRKIIEEEEMQYKKFVHRYYEDIFNAENGKEVDFEKEKYVEKHFSENGTLDQLPEINFSTEDYENAAWRAGVDDLKVRKAIMDILIQVYETWEEPELSYEENLCVILRWENVTHGKILELHVYNEGMPTFFKSENGVSFEGEFVYMNEFKELWYWYKNMHTFVPGDDFLN